MSTSPSHAVYVVRIRAEQGMSEDQAERALRGLLKAALRSYGLRCLSAEREQFESATQRPRSTSNEG